MEIKRYILSKQDDEESLFYFTGTDEEYFLLVELCPIDFYTEAIEEASQYIFLPEKFNVSKTGAISGLSIKIEDYEFLLLNEYTNQQDIIANPIHKTETHVVLVGNGDIHILPIQIWEELNKTVSIMWEYILTKPEVDTVAES
jgi:hypothetical protein